MLKNIFNTFFVRIVNAIVNFAVAIIISNYLGAEGKGVQGLILTTISLLIILLNIVGAGSMAYLIPRNPFYTLIIPSYLWNTLLIIIAYILLPLLHIVDEQYINHICILSLLLNFSTINTCILTSKEKIKKANSITLIQIIALIGALSLQVFILKITDVVIYIYSLYFAYTISLLYSYIITKQYFIFPSILTFNFDKFRKGTKNLFKYGFFNQLDIFAQVLSFRFSYYILGYYATNASIGIYSIGVSIIEAIWLISRSISMVQNARIINSRDIKYSTDITIKMLKLSSALVLVATIILMLFPPEFYSYIFGDEFGEVRNVIISLSPGIIFFNASFLISGFFSGVGLHYINSIASIVGLFVTVIGAFIIIPHWGMMGAGITASCSYASTTLTKMVWFSKKTNTSISAYIISKSDIAFMKNETIGLLKKKK